VQPHLRKLTAARARLILERPFIGSLVMHLPLEAVHAPWCRTFATDSRTFYFNPAYIERLDFAQTQFVLAHEALHCALGHFARRSHRVLRRWDAATDYAVNMLLLEEGLEPPPGALIESRFRGMAAEEIYALLPADTEAVPLDGHLAPQALREPSAEARRAPRGTPTISTDAEATSSTADGDGWDDAGNEAPTRSRPALPLAPLAPDETDALARRWRSRVVAAEQHARQAGRQLSGAWARLVRDIVRPQLPWRVLLSRYVCSVARDDYTFQRLSRRDGPALMPRLASAGLDIVVAIDTSASIDDADLAAFSAEIDTMKSQLQSRVTLLACDEAIDARSPWRFEPWEAMRMPPDLRGGGGTAFAPVFEWIAQGHFRPDVVVYFTDGEGEFPPTAPAYPVVWLVKGSAAVPWGERIQLN
jgi:predicted metal-dependent peptidase